VRTAGLRKRTDIQLGIGLLVLGQLEASTYVTGTPHWVEVVALSLLAPAVAIGARRPLVSAVAVLAITAAAGVIASPPGSATLVLAWVIVFFRLGAGAGPRRLALGGALIVVVGLAGIPASDHNLANWIAANTVSTILPFLLGYLWRRRGEARALRAEAMRLDAERDRAAAEAAERERERLARELHDVVSHTVGTIVVQAEAGDVLLDHDPEAARRSLQAIESEAREAMTELRRLLGLMRGAEGEAALRTPQRGLADIEHLVERVRGAGLPVDLVMEGEPVALPPALDLSAYRVLQEGLTNVLKHTRDARAKVRLVFRSNELEVEIADDGRAHDGLGTGQGLAGARERVALLRGSFDAGPLQPHGWRLRATFPLDGDTP
jgi:signal transduction histidine kinase